MDEIELRILVDPSGAHAFDDPSMATFKLVYYDTIRKKIDYELEYPFSGYTDAKQELKEFSRKFVKAVDRPWLKKKTRTEIEEIS